MSDPDQPKGQHRFAKGHQKFGGRQKGGPNKNLREHAITGLTRGGANKAKKAGKNGNINGLAYFFEDLAEKNSSAAAALAGKLISSEPEQKTDAGGYSTPIIVNSVVSGNMFAPGKTVLLPFDECEEAWRAYHAGDEAWSACLKKLEPMLTKPAFEALSLVVPPPVTAVEDDRRSNVTPLRLIESPASQEIEPSTEELNNMTIDQLFERMREHGLGGMTLNELRDREPDR